MLKSDQDVVCLFYIKRCIQCRKMNLLFLFLFCSQINQTALVSSASFMRPLAPALRRMRTTTTPTIWEANRNFRWIKNRQVHHSDGDDCSRGNRESNDERSVGTGRDDSIAVRVNIVAVTSVISAKEMDWFKIKKNRCFSTGKLHVQKDKTSRVFPIGAKIFQNKSRYPASYPPSPLELVGQAS